MDGEMQSLDHTLLDFEIERFQALHEDFIRGFERNGLKGATYDMHVGNALYKAVAGINTDKAISVSPNVLTAGAYSGNTGYEIDAGQTVIIRSSEIVHMPDNMLGRTSLRVTLASRGLSHSSAIIDPGYWGNLFIAVTNISNSAIEIPTGEPLISVQFIKLHDMAQNPLRMSGPVTDLPEDRRPSAPRNNPYSPPDLSRRIDEIVDQICDLEDSTKVDRERSASVQRIVEFAFFAAVAGLLASVSFGAIQLAHSLGGSDVQVVSVGLVAFGILIGLVSLVDRSIRTAVAVSRSARKRNRNRSRTYKR